MVPDCAPVTPEESGRAVGLAAGPLPRDVVHQVLDIVEARETSRTSAA